MLKKENMKLLNSKGLFNYFDSKSSRVMDGGLASSVGYNVGMPAGILSQLTALQVEIITKKLTADLLIGSREKMLDWEKNDLIVPIIEKTGEVKEYSDFGNPPTSGVNPNFAQMGHYRFSSNVKIGSLEARQLSLGKMSAETIQMNASLEALAIEFNNVAFYGRAKPVGSTYPVYGLLTNPDLSTYQQATSTMASTTFESFRTDILSLVQTAINQANGNLNLTSTFKIGIANKRYANLALINTLGVSVAESLKSIMPNVEFIQVPDFDGAYTGSKDVMYAIGENNVGGVAETAKLGFSEIGLASTIEVHTNYTMQTISSGSTGAVILKPYNIARAYFDS